MSESLRIVHSITFLIGIFLLIAIMSILHFWYCDFLLQDSVLGNQWMSACQDANLLHSASLLTCGLVKTFALSLFAVTVWCLTEQRLWWENFMLTKAI